MMTPQPLFQPFAAQPWRPHQYQKTAVKWLLEHAAAGLFLDPGLGKTAIVLAALTMLKRQGLGHKTLVIAPLRVCHAVWPREVAKWADFMKLKVIVLHGKDKADLLKESADLYVINPEGLGWLLAQGHFKRHGFDVLVVDELTRFKHPRTLRFKLLKPLLGTFRRRWGLTGTPVANGLMDLFGQCYVLDEGNALGRFIMHFRSEYFTSDYNGWAWSLKPGAEQRIYQRISPLALRMSAEEYLKLPQLITTNISVELPPDAQETYVSFEDDLIAKIGDATITAASKAAALMKCRQVTGGAVYTNDVGKWTTLHDEKIEALEELVEELQGSPLLVAYEFQHERMRLEKRLNAPTIGGGVSPKASAELIDLWNLGRLPVLLGHPQALAHGVNLQSGPGHHVAWFTPTWDFELYDQFNRRLWRQGTTAKRVFVYHLIAHGTIDEAVLAAIHLKRTGQQALFDALVALRKFRPL